jgi:hypothetical protein
VVHAAEAPHAVGLDRVTFRVDPGEEAAVTEQLGAFAELVRPYR